ncbi:uncharacterized protein LOC111865293 [Cryptotermes secundus]|uniref:uncharacterized protein LOC111865293 n=1 Tax=Cryptotermes secundus TaxID=105785 RepID=UPI001454D0BB|nr:uncharacterized protein LOC111865293 [Cryptotermes secundus]
MLSVSRKTREVFGNITDIQNLVDVMASDIRRAVTDAEVQGGELSPQTSAVEPCISTDSPGLQYEQDSLSNMSPADELSKNSSFLLNQKFTKDDALKNCGDWVDNQSSHIEKKNEGSRPSQKRKQAPLCEEQCDSPDENDDADSVVSSACRNKRRRKAVKMKDEQLDLQCEWQDCDYVTCNLDQFVRHVSLHIPHLEVKVNEDQEGNGFVVYPRILPASISIDDVMCPVIHLFILTPVPCSNIPDEFIGLKIGNRDGN